MTISIIATVYNEGPAIRKLLDSILAQTIFPDEVVICDGGSSDDTVAQIEAYADRLPLRVIVEPGANISRGRNVAIAAAREALADHAFQEDTRRFIARERAFLQHELSRIPGLHMFPSRANYLLLKLDSHYSSRELGDFLRRKYHLLIRLCTDFAGLDGSFIRIAVKNRESNQKLLEAMKDFFAF